MNSLKIQLETYANLTQEALERFLPDNGNEDTVTSAMRYSLLGGGKRLRAALALAFCNALGGKQDNAIVFACALEMVHAYSLIHDDLPCMDDDDMRRGRPSCHIAFGEPVALLAGDGLLTKAFETLSYSQLPPAQIVQAVGILAKAAGHLGMIGGQRLDLENETITASIERVEQTNRLKTGALISAAVALGCIAAGADAKTRGFAECYAQHIGAAFQITDDILDCTSSQEELGKPIGSDAQNHKTTYVSMYGIEEARTIAEHRIEQAKQALDAIDGCSTQTTGFLYELADYILTRRS